jgi:hypothetical protein
VRGGWQKELRAHRKGDPTLAMKDVASEVDSLFAFPLARRAGGLLLRGTEARGGGGPRR